MGALLTLSGREKLEYSIHWRSGNWSSLFLISDGIREAIWKMSRTTTDIEATILDFPVIALPHSIEAKCIIYHIYYSKSAFAWTTDLSAILMRLSRSTEMMSRINVALWRDKSQQECYNFSTPRYWQVFLFKLANFTLVIGLILLSIIGTNWSISDSTKIKAILSKNSVRLRENFSPE